ncbi:hypothetical protein GCM10027049_10630 [Mucilaginibacter puniceus]
MRNLKHFDENALNFHDNIVKRKKNTVKDPDLKTRLTLLRENVKGQFETFDTKFSLNKLQHLTSFNFDEKEKIDLLKLYNYQSSVIQALKTKITTTETNRIIATCQNCTLSEINSFDHLLPKAEFSEFVVHPKNLFPSCTICNGYKSKAWLKDGSRMFLNLYLDELPKEQFLFVDIIINKDLIETKFYLDNHVGIDKDLFDIIQSHYANLSLFKRFSENSDIVISPLRNNIESYIGKLRLRKLSFLGLRDWKKIK